MMHVRWDEEADAMRDEGTRLAWREADSRCDSVGSGIVVRGGSL
jgi:hypothetical protein